MSDFTIDDMIASAIDKKPETFKDAFNSIMAAKVAAAVEAKKQEVAAQMFNDEEQEDNIPSSDETDELNLDSQEDDSNSEVSNETEAED